MLILKGNFTETGTTAPVSSHAHSRKNMKEVNKYDAPYGHITVKQGIDSNGDVVCDDCAGYNRAYRQDVISSQLSSFPCHRNSPRIDDLCSR